MLWDDSGVGADRVKVEGALFIPSQKKHCGPCLPSSRVQGDRGMSLNGRLKDIHSPWSEEA